MTHISIVPTDLWHALDARQRVNSPPIVPIACEAQRIQLLRLPHPRTGVPSLFLPHINSTTSGENSSRTSILELQAVAPHSSRSWFLENKKIIEDGKLLLLTPVDPLFLLIPILQAAQPADGTIGNFRPLDDIFEEAASRLSQTKPFAIRSTDVLHLAGLDCVSDALKRICDYKELTEEISVYRLSRTKLLQNVSIKVARLSQSSVFDGYPSLQRQLARDGLLDEGKDELRQAGRIRAACEMLSQYLPPDVTSELIALHDFTALDAYLHALSEEANVLVPVGARPIAIIKGAVDDKKRKATSQLSKGVSKLMKVNTSGMTKISAFFKPAK